MLISLSCLEEKRHRAVAAKDSRDHVKALQILRRFFPNIPKGTCSEILEHGFLKGSGRVGRSTKLGDRLKIQLAVNAHIRHRLTQYDSLLAGNREQHAKLAAREMVYGQVQAIADSWRAPSPQAQNSNSRMLVSRGSAATLQGNRQRRAQQIQVTMESTEEAQILEEALDQLHLNENGDMTGARVEAAQRIAQEKAQIKARKKKKKKLLRLQRKSQRVSIKSNHPPRLLRSDFSTLNSIPTNSDTLGDDVQLGRKGDEIYMPTSDRSVDVDPPRYSLRSSHRTSSSTPMNNNRFSNDMQLQQRDHESHMPKCGPSPNTHPPRQSHSSRRKSDGKIGGLDVEKERRGCPYEKSRSKGRQMIEDSEWMDID